jgi:hypothetical protein
MTAQNGTILDSLIRNNGLAWMVDSFGDKDQLLPRIHSALDDANKIYSAMFTGTPFTEEALSEEAIRDPHKVRAFLQAVVGITFVPEMLVMVWRILQGDEIHRVRLDYEYQQSFRLHVQLRRTYYAESVDDYHSDDILDFGVLRHVGSMLLNGKPVLEGFYAIGGNTNEETKE